MLPGDLEDTREDQTGICIFPRRRGSLSSSRTTSAREYYFFCHQSPTYDPPKPMGGGGGTAKLNPPVTPRTPGQAECSCVCVRGSGEKWVSSKLSSCWPEVAYYSSHRGISLLGRFSPLLPNIFCITLTTTTTSRLFLLPSKAVFSSREKLFQANGALLG